LVATSPITPCLARQGVVGEAATKSGAKSGANWRHCSVFSGANWRHTRKSAILSSKKVARQPPSHNPKVEQKVAQTGVAAPLFGVDFHLPNPFFRYACTLGHGWHVDCTLIECMGFLPWRARGAAQVAKRIGRHTSGDGKGRAGLRAIRVIRYHPPTTTLPPTTTHDHATTHDHHDHAPIGEWM